MDNCFFCESLEGKDFFLENELAFAKFDGYPVSKGHVTVMPKRHIEDWWSATIGEREAIFDLIDEARTIIDEEYAPDGYNIGMNLGEAAGQTVMHLHIHLIPRYQGDVEDPKGGVRGVIPDKQKY